MICALSLFACNNDEVLENKTEVCAFVKEVKDNVIVVDVAEYITTEDEERMEELELTLFDMPDGYFINNPETETAEYNLTEETVYTFIDWHNDFVAEGENLEFTTTNREDFIKYLETYENSEPGMPFFFELNGNDVVSVTEKIMM
jgi:hypothetical protein